MKYFLPFFFLFTLTLLLLELAERVPLASHRDYMRTEYPDLVMDQWIDYWEGYVTG